MISKHSHEQSTDGEGVEVVTNKPYEDPVHGKGQYTEKRLYLNSKLPAWVRGFIPKIFYITEKAWNYYPYTVTEYTCSFLPKFHVRIETKFEDNNGCSLKIFGDKAVPLEDTCYLDIAYDDLPAGYYKKSEDLTLFKSEKTGRGPLEKGWRQSLQPIMCSYKRVTVRFDVYGLQTRVENFVHKNIRDILLAGHRQAVAWIDEWYGMSLEDVRQYEARLQEETNRKVKCKTQSWTGTTGDSLLPIHSGKPLMSRSTSWNTPSETDSCLVASCPAESKTRPRLPSAPK